MSIEKLRWAAIISFIVSMVVLIGGGFFAKDWYPPYPGKVVDAEGKVLFQKQDIMAGQDVYQRYGLMDHGSVWCHGSQRGMEFSAVTLHLLGEVVREALSQKEQGKPFEGLEPLPKEIVTLKSTWEIKTNRYDPKTDTLTPGQTQALGKIHQLWEKTFRDGENRYGFLPQTVPTAEERLQISRFFFWTAWVASTKRPGKDHTYTNNWPADRTVGNVPTQETYLWTLGGILGLPLSVFKRRTATETQGQTTNRQRSGIPRDVVRPQA